MCQTGSGVQNVTTECFPIQWHVIAPVLPGGWDALWDISIALPMIWKRTKELRRWVQVMSITMHTSTKSHALLISNEPKIKLDN